MMRTLIIGSDNSLCFAVNEFMEKRGLISTVVFSYKEGIDKLFYEKPDLTVIELTSHELSPALINKINSSQNFELVDIKKYREAKEGKKPVLILEEANQIDILLDFLKSYIAGFRKIEQESFSEDAEEEGNIESVSYPTLLSNIYRNKQTGILDINSQDKLRVYIVDGVPVFAEGGDVETALGRMLLSSGKISETSYETALETATEKKQRLGEILVGMGLVSPHELSSFLELQVKEKIIRGFSCIHGFYSFTEDNEFIDRMVAYQINLPQVLYEGIKRCVGVERIEKIFFQKEKNPTVELNPDQKKEANTMGVGPKESRFIQLLKDRDQLSDIVKTSRLDRAETLKLLYFLYLLGSLKVSGLSIPEIKKYASKKSAKNEGVGRGKKEEVKTHPEDIIILEEEIADTDTERLMKLGGNAIEDKPGEAFVGRETIDLNNKRVEIEMGSSKEESSSDNDELKPIDLAIQKTQGMKRKPKKEAEIRPDYINQEPDKIEQIREHSTNLTEEEKLKKKEALVDEILNFHFSIREKNYYQLLGLSKGATKDQIKTSYFNLVKKFHPDANPDVKKEIREKTEEIFTKVTSAYETLFDDQKRKEYDSRDEVEKVKSQVKTIYDAELAYKQGESFLKQRNYKDAEEKFRQSVSLNPAEAAYLGALAWARFLGAQDKEPIIAGVKKEFEKAINMNPNAAESYFYLGNVYKHIDDIKKAETNFLKAVEINPDFIEAKRELRLLQQRKSESGIKDKKREKKFWSSLFKK